MAPERYEVGASLDYCHDRHEPITKISKLTRLTKNASLVEFFASVVSFAFFVMGLRDSLVFVRCLLD